MPDRIDGYAQGIFDIAQAEGSLEKVENELFQFSQLFQGNEQLRTRLGQLTQAANKIDAGWQQYRQQCFTGRISGTYDREWMAMLVPRAMPSDAGAGCTSYYTAMDNAIKEFKTLMQDLVSDARQAGVLPGTVRDALRSNRLEFDWDR